MRISLVLTLSAALALPLNALPVRGGGNCNSTPQQFSRPVFRANTARSMPTGGSHGGNYRPPVSRPSVSHAPVNRPTRTSSGTPVRWVNVPGPGCSTGFNPGYNHYYGYGGYSFGGSGYQFAVQGSAPSTSSRSSSARRSYSIPPTDRRSTRNYLYGKAVTEFAKENSVAGKIYLKQDSITWFLSFEGSPNFTDKEALVPCTAYVEGDERERPVLLTLTFDKEGKVISSKIEPQKSRNR